MILLELISRDLLSSSWPSWQFFHTDLLHFLHLCKRSHHGNPSATSHRNPSSCSGFSVASPSQSPLWHGKSATCHPKGSGFACWPPDRSSQSWCLDPAASVGSRGKAAPWSALSLLWLHPFVVGWSSLSSCLGLMRTALTLLTVCAKSWKSLPLSSCCQAWKALRLCVEHHQPIEPHCWQYRGVPIFGEDARRRTIYSEKGVRLWKRKFYYEKRGRLWRRKFHHENGVRLSKREVYYGKGSSTMRREVDSRKRSSIMRGGRFPKGSSIMRREFDYEKGNSSMKGVRLWKRKFILWEEVQLSKRKFYKEVLLWEERSIIERKVLLYENGVRLWKRKFYDEKRGRLWIRKFFSKTREFDYRKVKAIIVDSRKGSCIMRRKFDYEKGNFIMRGGRLRKGKFILWEENLIIEKGDLLWKRFF